MKQENKMKNIKTKALPNRQLDIRIAIGLSGLVLIALLIQIGR